ncbi:MAG: SDR family NAD(P)-dependent oxidoreductase [Steroidobacteraceae bacterium]
MDLGLRGKKAIVTGATKGIGRAIVELFAAEGVDIGLCSRTQEDVDTTVQALKRHNVNVVGEAVNVRDGESYKAWLGRAVEALGGCDIFVPNVSAGGGFDSDKNWTRNFEVDVMHTVRGCDTLMPHLEKCGSGSIVIIASTNALETFGVPQAFNAMKAGLITYAKQLAQHVGKKGVRVNSVSPGPVYFEGGNWEMIKGTMPKVFDYAMRQIPCGRMGTPEEVARIVAFVASPAGSLITGSNVVADNGFTKRVQF